MLLKRSKRVDASFFSWQDLIHHLSMGHGNVIPILCIVTDTGIELLGNFLPRKLAVDLDFEADFFFSTTGWL